jgi:hypothetical protein
VKLNHENRLPRYLAMPTVYLFIGTILALMGFIGLAVTFNEDNASASLLFLSVTALACSSYLIRRGVNRKPLFSNVSNARIMLASACKEWPTGLASLCFYSLSISILVFGTNDHLGYAAVYPWLSMAGVFLATFFASAFLWRYLKNIKAHQKD